MNPKPIYKSPAGKAKIMALYDAVLARWPVEHETFTLPTRHGDTFIIAGGEKPAPALVLLHGAASNAVSWIGDIVKYSQHFRVYAVDIPGEPGRSTENRPAWDGPDYSDWLEDVLDGLKTPQASLLGISQGGWTALRFATIHPERATRLVLLAPGGIVPTRSTFILRAVIYSMLGHWGSQKITRMVSGKQTLHPEAVQFMDAIYTHFHTRREKEYIYSDKELKCLNMPVLFIGGAQDALFNMDAAAIRMQKLVPRIQVVIRPNTGHALINLSEQILPFLSAE